MAGIDMLHVPYKSNPQAVTDLLGGQISLFFGDVSTALPHVRAGKLKSYAVSGISGRRWRRIFRPSTRQGEGIRTDRLVRRVRAGRTATIVRRLNGAIADVLNDKAARDALLAAGIEPAGSTPDELRAYVGSERRNGPTSSRLPASSRNSLRSGHSTSAW